MGYVVKVDDRGRVLLPSEVRRRLGLRRGSRLLLRVTEDGRLEAIPLERELREVARVFEERFRGWREEDHEASRLLLEVVGGGARDS